MKKLLKERKATLLVTLLFAICQLDLGINIMYTIDRPEVGLWRIPVMIVLSIFIVFQQWFLRVISESEGKEDDEEKTVEE